MSFDEDNDGGAYHAQVELRERFYQEKEAKMSLIVRETGGGGGDFAPAPTGAHLARCYRIIDLGTQVRPWQGQDREIKQVLISWELPDTKIPDGKLAGKPFSISERFTGNINPKSKLKAVLEAWRGRQFTKEELDSFNMQNVLGKSCYLNVVHSNNNGKTYANIASVMPVPAGMKVPAQVNESVLFSLEKFDLEVFNSLSKNLQETIKKSPEYAKAVATKDRVELSSGDVEELNDDIPF
jgi:hypothetical protein